MAAAVTTPPGAQASTPRPPCTVLPYVHLAGLGRHTADVVRKQADVAGKGRGGIEVRDSTRSVSHAVSRYDRESKKDRAVRNA